MASIQQLILTRGQLKAHLTRFKTFLDKHDVNQGIIALEARLQKLEPVFDRFDEVQSMIENASEGNETEESVKEREQFETMYFDLVAHARGLIRRNEIQIPPIDNVARNNIHNANEPQLGVKLPVIKIPVFDGSQERWIKFRDTFQSMIDDNPTLTNIQKFHYLDSAITGDAARAIEALGISTANYTTAWAALKERFEDSKALSHYHVRSLFELSVMVKDSHVSLRKLIDSANNHLLALRNLGEAIDGWDSIIVYLLSTKLDAYAKREWEKRALQLAERPKVKEIMEFLNAHCRYLERTDHNKQEIHSKNKVTAGKPARLKSENLSTHVTQKVNCPVCNGTHNLYHCEEFIKLPVQSRVSEVQKHQLCFNCLKPNYQNKNCTSGHCRKCSKKHNTLLHRDENSVEESSKGNTSNSTTAGTQDSDKVKVTCNHTQDKETPVILATAMINVQDFQGNLHECRILLDGGAQSHFITKRLCDQLRLKLVSINQPVSGLGNQQTNLNYKTEVKIKSKCNAYSTKITCLVIQRITGDMSNVTCDPADLNIPKNVTLADPQFHSPRSIDLLVGAELFWSLLCVGQIALGPSLPIMQKTKFGWVLGGPIASS